MCCSIKQKCYRKKQLIENKKSNSFIETIQLTGQMVNCGNNKKLGRF